MCGIICAIRKVGGKKGPAMRQIVKEQFLAQKSRGTEGFGIIEIMPSGKVRVFRTTDQLDFLMQLKFEVNKDAAAVIAHHRIPTSSANRIDQTHPILTTHKDFEKNYLTVHNGIIQNDDTIKLAHEAAGFTYTTDHVGKGPYSGSTVMKRFNDSEALAIELALMLEGKQDTVDARGSCAFFTVGYDKKTNKADSIFFGRNTNPLAFIETKEHLLIASEAEGETIKPNTLCRIDLADLSLVMKPMTFLESDYSASRGYQSSHSSVPAYTGQAAGGTQNKPVIGFVPKTDPVMTKEVSTGTIEPKDDEDETIQFGFTNEDVETARNLIIDAIDDFLWLIDDDDDVAELDYGTESEELTKKVTTMLSELYRDRHKESLNNALEADRKDREEELEADRQDAKQFLRSVGTPATNDDSVGQEGALDAALSDLDSLGDKLIKSIPNGDLDAERFKNQPKLLPQGKVEFDKPTAKPNETKKPNLMTAEGRAEYTRQQGEKKTEANDKSFIKKWNSMSADERRASVDAHIQKQLTGKTWAEMTIEEKSAYIKKHEKELKGDEASTRHG